MLEDLSIKNFALIDSVSLEFGSGLNILSGETGAGKSILIGALTFLLGGKAGPDSIRTGTDEARVSGNVLLGSAAASARAWLSEKGIQMENDRVLLRRSLRQNGKSLTWIQDTAVTRAELADFTAFLVDIHGQHDHQSLLKVTEHRRFLDRFAGIVEEVREFTRLYNSLAEKRALRDEMNSSEQERAQRIELLEFGIAEIEAARLSASEEDDLSAEEQRLSQYERLFATIDELSSSISVHEGALSGLKRSRALLEAAAQIDSSLSGLSDRTSTAWYELEDIADSIRRYKDSLSFDPERLAAVQERLSDIFKLKKKYGQSVPAILSWCEEARAQLEKLTDRQSSRSTLDAEIGSLEKQIYQAGRSISAKRQASAGTLEKGVEGILASLGMKGTRFAVSITVKESTGPVQLSSPWGFDDIEFMISANPGEPLRPLARIASGGELSRVMLALKTVLADADEAGTLIFDEIDTGIGGEVALSVGGHLKKLAERKQILCITHLASIAVRADTHIKIEKISAPDHTVTRADRVEGQSRAAEVARMLAGDGVSAASIQHAEELLRRYAAP